VEQVGERGLDACCILGGVAPGTAVDVATNGRISARVSNAWNSWVRCVCQKSFESGRSSKWRGLAYMTNVVVLGSESSSGRGSQRSRVCNRVGGVVYSSCGLYCGYDCDGVSSMPLSLSVSMSDMFVYVN
jgi:hypothetical protein